MTDSSQDVNFGVVTPSLPAVLVVRPDPTSATDVRTPICAEQPFHAAAEPISTTACDSTHDKISTDACTLTPDRTPPSNITNLVSDFNDVQDQKNITIITKAIVDADDNDTINECISDIDDANIKDVTSTVLINQNEPNTPIESVLEHAKQNEINVKDIVHTKQTEEYSIHSPFQDSEGNLSVSTDETLHNSDSDSFAFVNKESSLFGFGNKGSFGFDNGEHVVNVEMGNQHSDKKSRQSDDDTPDEAKTKCCEIPKKKLKDRYSKATSRSSKSAEDYDFEDDELYPFESRTRSELEIVDPVELEPFEIIETDDIKFIPGAGTSDVIKSASESKFKTIPEEGSIDGEEKFDTFIIKHDRHDRPPDKEVVVFNKGVLVLESGTSTAHSTFEFKQVKARPKAAVKQNEEKPEPTYENITTASCSSVGSSKTNSSSSSNGGSRKNSKEGIQKPSRQKNKKKSDGIMNDPKNKEKIEIPKKTKSKQTQETTDESQTGNKALILTQTMFSIPNPQEMENKPKVLNESNMPQNSYQNVNVGVKFGPTGITICNTAPESKSKVSTTQNITPAGVKDTSVADTAKCLSQNTASSTTGTESHLYETLTPELKGSNITSNNDRDRLQCNAENTNVVSVDKQSMETASSVIPEHVPPPSPLALDILEEEEEEEEEEKEEEETIEELNEDGFINEEKKRKSQIIEFTENVCKRLSQLLDDQPSVQSNTDNGKDTTEHIYETVTKEAIYSELIQPVSNKENSRESDSDGEVFTSDTNLSQLAREDSPSTLKRTLGDSGSYQITDTLSSSEDDLPEFFDPKVAQHPKRDSEILCDVLDAYTEEGINAVSAGDVADIVGSHTLEFGEDMQGHSTNKADKILSLPLQKFDDSYINKAPKTNSADEMQDRTPVAEIQSELTALPELVSAKEDIPVQYDTSGRQSVTYTESDLDISEHRDDLSTDSMLADDEDEETMEILFTKTYTEPVEGGEVFLSCTVVNSAYKEEHKKSETWLSDDALEYFEANASDVMSTAFMKAKKEMKDIQVCLQSLRKQMEHFHDDVDDISLPDIPVDALSPSDYFGLPRKAVTD